MCGCVGGCEGVSREREPARRAGKTVAGRAPSPLPARVLMAARASRRLVCVRRLHGRAAASCSVIPAAASAARYPRTHRVLRLALRRAAAAWRHLMLLVAVRIVPPRHVALPLRRVHVPPVMHVRGRTLVPRRHSRLLLRVSVGRLLLRQLRRLRLRLLRRRQVRLLSLLLGGELVRGRVLWQLVRLRGQRLCPKVVVVERLLGGNALGRVHAEELAQQVLRERLELLELVVKPVGVLLGVLAAEHVVVGELGDAGPRGLGGRAEQAEDERELLKLVAAGQDRLAQQQLGEDAADGPHVDRRAVETRTEQQLGGAVPERDDPVGVRSKLLLKGPREAKVCKLELPLVVDQQVGALDVAVEHAVLVAVGHPLEQLLHVALDLRRCEALPCVGEARQVVLAKLHHHVDGAFTLIVLSRF
mmetsp:Transcript_10411/g.22099  ORF Transcript_10411/g.22099 Transcript_10411/m.22099 type:complete len:417 (-) Transcript_10411:311-1561(-)